jgi:hypothetical protein
MRSLVALVPVVVFALASCGTGAAAPSDPENATASNGPVATCRATCSTAGDCGAPGDPLYDSSHFACQKGRCQWLGCRSASECSASQHGGNFVCQATPGGPPSCAAACQTASDCAPTGAQGAQGPAIEDASHFSCTAGACVWNGCRSTAECVAATHSNKVSCEQPSGAPAPTCVPTCTAATDCVIPGSGTLGDVHHYACKAGRCQWLGCRSTLECTTALSSSRYVCE